MPIHVHGDISEQHWYAFIVCITDRRLACDAGRGFTCPRIERPLTLTGPLKTAQTEVNIISLISLPFTHLKQTSSVRVLRRQD